MKTFSLRNFLVALAVPLFLGVAVPEIHAEMRLVMKDQATLRQKNTFAFNIRVDSSDPVHPVVTYDLAGLTSKVIAYVFIDGVRQDDRYVVMESDLKMQDNRAEFDLTGAPNGRVTFKLTAYNKTNVTEPTKINFGYVASVNAGSTLKFFSPYGITINNCFDADDFGNIIVTESRKTTSSEHFGNKGAGLYPFNAQMQPYVNSTNNRGFTAGLTASTDDTNNKTFYQAHYTEDGRLFLGSNDVNSYSLHELDPLDLEAPATRFIDGVLDATGVVHKANTDNNRIQPIRGIDSWGKGANLKLGIVTHSSVAKYQYRVQVYNVGKEKVWNKVPSFVLTNTYNGSTIPWVNPAKMRCLFSPDGTHLMVTQHRAAELPAEPGVVHYNVTTPVSGNYVADKTEKVGYAHAMARSIDGKYVARCESKSTIKIYEVGADGHTLKASPKYTITGFTKEVACNDLAFDYANNLYLCDASAEIVEAYQIPSGTFCTVPAPAKYAYNLENVADGVVVSADIDNSNGNVTLDWMKSGCNSATSIVVKRDGEVIRTFNNKTTATYTDGTVTSGTHTYVVEYRNGDEVLASSSVDVVCVPTISLKANLYASTVTLDWTPTFEAITDKVAIYHGGELIDTCPIDYGSYEITDAQAPYEFMVKMVSADNVELAASETVSFSVLTSGAQARIDNIKTVDGRAVVTLMWTPIYTNTSLSKNFSHYSVLCDGNVIYEKLGYMTCTHNLVPAGTHEYVVRMNFNDGSFVDSASALIEVKKRDYSKPTYSLEEVYNYQIVTDDELDQIRKADPANFDENKFFVAEYPLNHMRAGVSQYSSTPGDNYRQAVFKDGKWYLALLNSSGVFITNGDKKYIDMYTMTNTSDENRKLYDDYVSGTGLTEGVTYGAIVAIDANDPKSCIGKMFKEIEVVATDPSSNQFVAIDDATNQINIVTRASASNITSSTNNTYKLKNGATSYMSGATGYLSIFHHDTPDAAQFTGNPTSNVVGVGDIRNFTYGEEGAAQKGRVHYIAASGDLASKEGGYIYVAYNQTGDVSRIRVKENVVQPLGTSGDVSRNYNVSKDAAPGTLVSATENYAFPIAHFAKTTLTDEDRDKHYEIDPETGNKIDPNDDNRVIEYSVSHLNDKYFIHQIRNDGYYLVDATSGEYNKLPLSNSDIRSAGGLTFVYDDGTGQELFWVHPRTSTSNSFGNFAVELINLSAITDTSNGIDNFVDAFKNPVPVQSFSHEGLQGDGAGNASGVWFGAEYSKEDGCMYIYQYCPGTRFAKYRFKSNVDFPVMDDPIIDLTHKKGGEGAYHENDITQIDNKMSWTRPSNYGSTGNSKYRIRHYNVKLENAAGSTVRLNDCSVTYSMAAPVEPLSRSNMRRLSSRVCSDVEAVFSPGDEPGTINVIDPVGDDNEAALLETTFSIDYSRTDLRNGQYTLYVTPVYESVVSSASYVGEQTSTMGVAGIDGASYPVSAKAFKTPLGDGTNIYRIDLTVSRPEDNDTPVSYYTFEFKKRGETEFKPLTDYFVLRNGQHYFYADPDAQRAPAIRRNAISRASDEVPEILPFDGKIRGDYDIDFDQTYNFENDAPCMAFNYTMDDPEGSVYQITAHYGASNPAIAVDYSDQTDALPASSTIVTGVEDIEAANNGVKVYPVPAHDFVNVECGEHIETVEVYSTSGMLMQQVKFNGGENNVKIDIASIPAGIYLLRVNNTHTLTIVKK